MEPNNKHFQKKEKNRARYKWTILDHFFLSKILPEYDGPAKFKITR